jgi:hypothetical protein
MAVVWLLGVCRHGVNSQDTGSSRWMELSGVAEGMKYDDAIQADTREKRVSKREADPGTRSQVDEVQGYGLRARSGNKC